MEMKNPVHPGIFLADELIEPLGLTGPCRVLNDSAIALRACTAGPGVVIPAPERAEEIFRWNAFGALPREQAVRVSAPVPTRGATGPAVRGVPAGLAAAAPGAAPAAGRRPAGSPR